MVPTQSVAEASTEPPPKPLPQLSAPPPPKPKVQMEMKIAANFSELGLDDEEKKANLPRKASPP